MIEERNKILAEMIAGINWNEVHDAYVDNDWFYFDNYLKEYHPSAEELQARATRLLHAVAHGSTRYLACGQMEVYRTGYALVFNIGAMSSNKFGRQHTFERTGEWEFEFETNIP